MFFFFMEENENLSELKHGFGRCFSSGVMFLVLSKFSCGFSLFLRYTHHLFSVFINQIDIEERVLDSIS